MQSALTQIQENYKDQVKIVFKDFPLTRIHAQAYKAAEAARCAGVQDKYWEYHDILFANTRALQPDKLKQYAADLRLDTAQFDACLDNNDYTGAVGNDLALGTRLGVTGTPAFFVNGRFLSGAQPYSAFAELIDEALAAQ